MGADPHAGEDGAVRAAARGPVTVASLVEDLRRLGVAEGGTALVHTSLSALGWVCGAEQAVIEALTQALGRTGTLVMPAFSTHLTDPAHWRRPPVPEAWWPTIRAEMPAFDPLLTPTRGLGRVAECFRRAHGVVRSLHPHDSFAARGPAARALLGETPLEHGLGEGSPLARLYDANAHVLLLGATHGSNSSLHLSEHRARWPGKRWIEQGAPVTDATGTRRWARFQALEMDSDDFERLGADLEQTTDVVRTGAAGTGTARWMRVRALVDHGVAWLERHRG